MNNTDRRINHGIACDLRSRAAGSVAGQPAQPNEEPRSRTAQAVTGNRKAFFRYLITGLLLGFCLFAAASCGGKSGSEKGGQEAESSGAGTGGTGNTEAAAQGSGSAGGESRGMGPAIESIAVFVPGVMEGSPLYKMLAEGTRRAVDEAPGVELKIVEGGYNQGEWQDKVTALAASGQYGLIVTSNPSMPEICNEVSKSFPEQHFLVLDGRLEGNPRIYTFLYNQMEQAFFAGYYAGMVTGSNMEGINSETVVGLIVAQEYPMMNRVIRPGFELGLNQADNRIHVDYRLVGNWYDASRAAELAEASIAAGADVILVISGGASQGALTAAADAGKYIIWFDDDGFNLAPDTVIGCAVLRQDLAAYETVSRAIRGELPYGTAETAGTAAGYVDFLYESTGAASAVPAEIKDRLRQMIEKVKTGGLTLPVPIL